MAVASKHSRETLEAHETWGRELATIYQAIHKLETSPKSGVWDYMFDVNTLIISITGLKDKTEVQYANTRLREILLGTAILRILSAEIDARNHILRLKVVRKNT